ncbi:pyruvate, water dikinase regulatory protein [Oceanibaculum pacificum]|uniref:Putative pyruvate, phosphate dikinase regulatory protein n=1 Tax=Oceanibaculum pacificum TaxID=580166 RepID=A0A154WH10_9PROT|nr:pyruvate, water dikinase regulatory protein [Oceanibaculum pacificum]KZD12824.1 phosphoenolpyruvate synthase regulatory protein [Oceanibaculum pacificum]
MTGTETIHLHLVSDSTGETIHQVARACLVQFEGVKAIEHAWSLVRTSTHVDKVIAGIEAHPGPILVTLVDHQLLIRLEAAGRRLNIPVISVLDPVLGALHTYLGRKVRGRPGRQHELDAAYFNRIEAMQFTLIHDDGQQLHDIDHADILLVGVSRTSKTPTCLYLANRGLKVANVPLVPGVPLPREVTTATGPLVVGLTNDPNRLVQIRRNRLLMLNQGSESDYINLDEVRREVAEARRLFERQGWPVIDVSRRSIEETAAEILGLYQERKEREDAV